MINKLSAGLVIAKLKNFKHDLQSSLRSNQSNVLLGRWKIDYCEKTINKKIDLSNEDHCGTCNNNKNIYINNINFKKFIFF